MIMPPLVRKIEPGDIIGRCRIIRELGRGGVGTVYLATHQTLQIEVAVKILSPALSLDNPALGDRFIREAQLAARIRHPNVIAVMDAAHDEAVGAYFIVMEYVNGGSLAWHLRHGPLPEAKALAIITGIAQALVVAEESQVVHRDIKPENILIDLHGTPKLADLGLAKHIIDSRTSITIGGSFMGTPAYMSPDQARDAKVADTRDDIYSLGATFYECLTGRPPFQGDTPYNIMSELLTKPTPCPSELRPEIAGVTALVCRKMMAKDRELRYATARSLLDDLRLVHAEGDRARDRLVAASFDSDLVRVRRHELYRQAQFGIETSSDGVYAGAPDDFQPAAQRPFVPRPRDAGVFRSAALLVVVVALATIVLAFAGPVHPFTVLWARLHPPATPPPVAVAEAPAHAKTKSKERAHASKTEAHNTPTPAEPHPSDEHVADDHALKTTPSPASAVPVTSTETSSAPITSVSSPAPDDAAPVAAVPTSPVALPVDPNAGTNLAYPVAPAVSANDAVPDSAFTARDIAERTLDGALLAPTGHAELLKIVGKRDDHATTPTTWTFFFYDAGAAGHARIVTVSGGKVVKSGEDLVDFASPYTERMILPEEKVQKDSTDALQIAQTLAPSAKLTGSELSLVQQKYSVPMWRVTLWAREGDDERKLGDVTLLAENGTVIKRDLKQ
jgi:hypothetical protein